MSIVMTVSTLIIAVVSLLFLIALIVFVVGIYNSLVSLKVNIERASSNIDILAKQRFDEIPRLVEICKGYMQFEKETLQKVIEARSAFMNATGNSDKIKANMGLESALKSLFAVSEQYPNLKANEEFLHLQKRVTALENDIADRREFYNASVALFNTRIEQIPDILIARWLKYESKPLYKVGDKKELEPITVNL